jgi:hypothetical protein
MEIICCRSTDDIARKAFRLRYKVYGTEMAFHDDAIDHQNELYIDRFDPAARIYVAIRDDQAIATCRALYDRDFDFSSDLPQAFSSALEIPKFLSSQAGSLALSTKFAISASHRGSLAAHLVTAKMFEDLIEDDIHFVFSACAPHLYDFYSQLGFHLYAPTFSDDSGLWAPIVLATRDWEHLRDVRSPLYRYLEKKNLCQSTHPSVKWFYENYGSSIKSLLPKVDDSVLERVLADGNHGRTGGAVQGAGLFSGMTTEDVSKIIGSGRVLKFAAGDAIIGTAQIQDEMFIILSGQILEKRLDGELPSSNIFPGQVIGEIAMLTGTMRATDCIAMTDAELVALSRQSLAKLMKGNPDLASRLLFNLARLQSHKLLNANQDMVRLYLDIHDQ